MNRLIRIPQDMLLALRGWRAERRLRAHTIIDLTELLSSLQRRVDELETDVDELRADSRRIAELRIQVEDLLADHS